MRLDDFVCNGQAQFRPTNKVVRTKYTSAGHNGGTGGPLSVTKMVCLLAIQSQRRSRCR
jgi:hypothetical protein